MGRKRSRRAVDGASAPPATEVPRTWWALAGLALALASVPYVPALHGPPVFDDSYVHAVPEVQVESLADLPALWRAPHVPRKLTMTTFALNHLLHGFRPFGLHLVNVLLHLATGGLVLLLVRRLLAAGTDLAPRPAFLAAASGTAVWLLHPVHSQAVCYVWQRSTLLAAFLFLASLLAFVEGRLADGRRALAAYSICAATGVAACFAKENAATLPLFILLVEWLVVRRGVLRADRRALLAGAAAVAAVGAVAAWYLGPRFVHDIQAEYLRRGLTPGQRLLTEPRVLMTYLSLLAWPAPSRLHLDYDVTVSRSLLSPWTTLPSLAAVVALGAWAVRECFRHRWLALALLWFLGNLVIESTVIPLDLAYEHRLYLPSMGMLVLAGAAAVLLTVRHLGPVLLLLTLLFALWTAQRSAVWADPLALFEDNARKAPGNARVQLNLGQAHLQRGDLASARRAFERAATLDPGDVRPQNNLAALQLRLGDARAARLTLERLLRLSPGRGTLSGLHANLGIACLRLGDRPAAVRHLKAALEHGPTGAASYLFLARTFERLEETEAALSTLEEGRRRFPHDAEIEQLRQALAPRTASPPPAVAPGR